MAVDVVKHKYGSMEIVLTDKALQGFEMRSQGRALVVEINMEALYELKRQLIQRVGEPLPGA